MDWSIGLIVTVKDCPFLWGKLIFQPLCCKVYKIKIRCSIYKKLDQGSTIDQKRVYVSAYVLKKLGLRHVQGKNYKKSKKHKGYNSTSKTNDEKPFWF